MWRPSHRCYQPTEPLLLVCALAWYCPGAPVPADVAPQEPAACELEPPEHDQPAKTVLLLQVDKVVSRGPPQALPGLAQLNASSSSLQQAALGGGQAARRLEAEISAIMMRDTKRWVVFPILALLIVLACLGWLYCAMAAQTGRCDNPAAAGADREPAVPKAGRAGPAKPAM
mmetsp:Transcript_101292/g.312413  ORF Transcript_101292/g.312413 Transcript_101292/m.312413 type:complete len:172 (-) Transcript_101292:58-573(-)